MYVLSAIMNKGNVNNEFIVLVWINIFSTNIFLYYN